MKGLLLQSLDDSMVSLLFKYDSNEDFTFKDAQDNSKIVIPYWLNMGMLIYLVLKDHQILFQSGLQ